MRRAGSLCNFIDVNSLSAAEYNVFVEHFYLYNKLQEHWNGFDAYARVCMVLGANQFLHVIR